MTVADATPDLEQVDRHDRAFLGHPRGLWYLAFTEAWERFWSYGMQALLVLYMVKYLLLPGRIEHVAIFEGPSATFALYRGLEGQALASDIFGTYIGTVSHADARRGPGGSRARAEHDVSGRLLMAAGHFLMAVRATFLLALLCLVLGPACFKGNIASQVGALYRPGRSASRGRLPDLLARHQRRRDRVAVDCGRLGEKVGWHYGFGGAGVGMLIGLRIYLNGRRYCRRRTADARSVAKRARPKLGAGDGPRHRLLILLLPVLAVRVPNNQQIFNAYLVWADKSSISFLGKTLPTTWLVTLDAALSFSMLVAVAAFWKWWGTKRREPDEISKMIIGSFFTIAGGLCLFMAALTQPHGGKIPPVLADHVPSSEQHRLRAHPADQPRALLEDRA